jgi:hypothetical protein
MLDEIQCSARELIVDVLLVTDRWQLFFTVIRVKPLQAFSEI